MPAVLIVGFGLRLLPSLGIESAGDRAGLEVGGDQGLDLFVEFETAWGLQHSEIMQALNQKCSFFVQGRMGPRAIWVLLGFLFCSPRSTRMSW